MAGDRNRRVAAVAAVCACILGATAFVANPAPAASGPQVRLASPAAGSVLSGTVVLRAEVAPGYPATGMIFKAGSKTLGQDASAPFEFAWDTTSVKNGGHKLRVQALTATGNGARSARVSVRVDNASAPTSTTTTTATGPPVGGTPTLTVTPIVTGLEIPWDLAFLPSGELVFTERPGRIDAWVNGQKRVLATPTDVRASGEGGLLGIAVDPSFATNRRIYTCYNTSTSEVKIEVWTVDAAITSLTRVGTLLGGLPAISSGRHSGCRTRIGPDGFLWVGTGDAATGTNPQDVNSLGGKVLRIDRFTGAAAPDNPGGTRWYTRGHRNVQGLAFRPGSGAAFSLEHGPDRDDELNRLVPGANYGWNPVPGYNEGVPMTFSGAQPAVWSSGVPTIATSGATFLTGNQWRDWNGRLAVCALKGSHLRVMGLNAAGTSTTSQTSVLTTYGRLRTPVQGPDGSLYVTTSNGGGADQILKVTPS